MAHSDSRYAERSKIHVSKTPGYCPEQGSHNKGN